MCRIFNSHLLKCKIIMILYIFVQPNTRSKTMKKPLISLHFLDLNVADGRRVSRRHSSLRGEGLRIDHMTGMAFNPMNGAWRLDDKDLDVNYLPAVAKPV